jgi:hypothetical protein
MSLRTSHWPYLVDVDAIDDQPGRRIQEVDLLWTGHGRQIKDRDCQGFNAHGPPLVLS